MIWALAASAFALETGTFELGGDDTTAIAQLALKLDVCQPDYDVTLVTVGPYAFVEVAVELRPVVYQWMGGDDWSLVWNGPAWSPDLGTGIAESPEQGVPLLAGELYAIGIWIDSPGVGYAYDEIGPQNFPWGTCSGSLFTGSGNDPVVPSELVQEPSDHSYRMDLKVTYPTDGDADGWPSDDDCNDGDPLVHPEAPERCNGIDDNCDEDVDNDVVDLSYYPDTDGDGFGDPAGTPSLSCNEPPIGHVLDATDCDDANGAVFPGAVELCNEADDDCDLLVDDGIPAWWWFPDADADGHGAVGSTPVVSCADAVDGHVTLDDDCDDARSDIFPTSPEVCDGVDQDCNGLTDDGVLDMPASAWFPDVDADGFGDRFAVGQMRCDMPVDLVADATDCDDANAARFPEAPEVCNGVDDDCDGTIAADENADGDSDGALDCADCDPASALAFPGAPEVCDDGVDQDCDGADLAPCEVPEPTPNTGEPVGETKGCATVPNAPGFALAALALLRRRRLSARA